MREETHPLVICIYCKLPITRDQRPSIQLKNGDELHAECYQDYKDMQRRKMD